MRNARFSVVTGTVGLLVGLTLGLFVGGARRPPGRGASPTSGVLAGRLATQAPARPAPARRTPRFPRSLPSLERLAWSAVWAVSVAVISLYLLNSFSQSHEASAPATRQPDPLAAAEVASPEPADSPLQADGYLEDGSPGRGVAVLGEELAPCTVEGDADCNCADFASQADAQAFFEMFLPDDPHHLDVDANGVACEWMSRAAAAGRR